MLKDEYLNRLIDAAHIEIYLSANDGGRIYWPWRMHPPKEATESYRRSCDKYIIDSDPLDDSVTTKDCFDAGIKYQADIVSLADVYLDKDATVDSILEGLEDYDDHAFGGQLLLPLQAPFVECWQELGEPTNHLIGIGGLKDAHVSERITAAQELREAVGPNVWLHGFGWGVSGRLSNEIRNNPDLLDSTDYSTPMQSVDYTYENGGESMSVAAMQAATQLITDLRSVTPFITEDTNQQTLF